MKLLFLLLFMLSSCFAADDLYRVEVNDKWGFINREGRVIIEPQYEECHYQFREGLASVKLGGKWGFISKENKMVIKPQFDGVYHIREGRIGVYFGEPFVGKMQTAYLDLAGNYVMKPTPDLRFSWYRGGHISLLKDEKWGFMNRAGKLIIPYEFDDVTSFSDGLAGARKGNVSGFINTKGEWAIKLDKAEPHSYASFSEGLAPVFDVTIGKYGYINSIGEWVIKPQFSQALAFHEGLAVVTKIVKAEDGWKDHLKGAINVKGEFIIVPKYNVLWDFEEGMAKARLKGGTIGFVSSKGVDLVIPDCISVDPFYKGLAYVTIGDHSDGYSGYIDKLGRWVWRPADYKKSIAAFYKKKKKC